MVTGAVAIAEFAHVVAERYPVNIALHTDHCPKDKLDTYVRPLLAISEQRVRDGGNPLFQSHMWDGSAVELAENLQIAAELLDLCARTKVVLEIEIGVVGGEEDGVVGEMNEKLYSTPDDAMRTVEALGFGEKGRYLLAATFGNVHGVYKPGNVKLRPEILKQIQDEVGEKIGRPRPFDLVFHGGSGSALEEIREAVSYGVVKMNVDTDTQYAFTRPIAGHMFANYDGVLKIDGEVGNKKAYDPRSYLKAAEGGMAARVVTACEDLLSAGTSVSAVTARAGGRGLSSRSCRRTCLPSRPGPSCRPTPGATALATGEDPAEVAARVPTSSAAWAALADRAFAAGNVVESYAYARVGYHRGLDALRRAGWKGHGPIPWAHEPNRGFLRSLHALGRAAAAIGEDRRGDPLPRLPARLRPDGGHRPRRLAAPPRTSRRPPDRPEITGAGPPGPGPRRRRGRPAAGRRPAAGPPSSERAPANRSSTSAPPRRLATSGSRSSRTRRTVSGRSLTAGSSSTAPTRRRPGARSFTGCSTSSRIALQPLAHPLQPGHRRLRVPDRGVERADRAGQRHQRGGQRGHRLGLLAGQPDTGPGLVERPSVPGVPARGSRACVPG